MAMSKGIFEYIIVTDNKKNAEYVCLYEISNQYASVMETLAF